MTTSGSYDNSTDLITIIQDSFGLINAHDNNEPLPAGMYSYAKRKLNELCAFLSNHKGLWLVSDLTVTLTPGTQSYTVGVGLDIDTPKPRQVTHASRIQSATSEIPINVVSRSEYSDIPNKILQSPALMVYYEKLRDNGVLWVWPTGTDSQKTITITVQRPIQDFDDQGNNPDLPREWILMLTYQLALILAPKYNGGAVPSDIKEIAGSMLSSILTDDEEKTSIRLIVER